jgi:DNA-binding response OmpR family regulator
MDGYLLCAEINRLYNTPIVIMSELNDIDKALSAFSADISTIVCKPFKLQELAAEIHKTLNTASSRKDCYFLPVLEEPDEHVVRYAYS